MKFRTAWAKMSKYFNLKAKQCNGVASLLERNDVLAILPTGLENAGLVVWPLQSNINDQILEARKMGPSAASTAGLT